jgi:hypothetical protein
MELLARLVYRRLGDWNWWLPQPIGRLLRVSSLRVPETAVVEPG